MSKKTDQYKSLPNPALSYITSTQSVDRSKDIEAEEEKEVLASPKTIESNKKDVTPRTSMAQAQVAPNESLRLRRKVEFTKNKPTRTQRAQLVFYPEDYRLAKRAAKLEGVSFNEWATATLAAAAQDTLEEYGQES